MSAKFFLRDQHGAVMVEVTIMLSITLILVFGAIDFLLLFYQWNAAAKAVQLGARLAAVSDPVASGLNRISQAVVVARSLPVLPCRISSSPATAAPPPVPAAASMPAGGLRATIGRQ